MDCGLGRCLVSLYSPQIYLDMGKLLWMCILLFRTEVITAHLTCYQFSPEHFVGNLIFHQTIHCEVSVFANTSFGYTQVCDLGVTLCKGGKHTRKL